jgi:hypothetical protein
MDQSVSKPFFLTIIPVIHSFIHSEIVHAALDRVSFVVQKQGEVNDALSISGSTISSISKDWGLPITQEICGLEGVSSTDDVSEISVRNKKALKTQMSSDGSMIISRETETSDPIPIIASESWKLSGALAVGVKKISPSQDTGIQIGIRDSLDGRVLYVSDIRKSSPFAQTPLRAGDVILSINDVGLVQNANVFDAYSALEKAGDEISILVRKSSESLNEFLNSHKEIATDHSQRSNPFTAEEKTSAAVSQTIQRNFSTSGSEGSVGVEHKGMSIPYSKEKNGPTSSHLKYPSPGGESFVFYEKAYGTSQDGYNSSKKIKIVKSHPQESIGLELTPVETERGKVLLVTNIFPRSKAANTKIQVGEAILAINGVDFRCHPDAEKALATIRRARKNVNIEVHQLSLYPLEISSDDPNQQDNSTSHERNNDENVRPRVFCSNDHMIYQTCTPKIAGKLLGIRSIWGLRRKDESIFMKSSRKNDVSEAPVPNDHSKVWIRVTKEHPSEKVGISFATLEKNLVVTNVSPSGLLRGTPILPGDTVLSINRVDFRVDPDARYAFELVSMATDEVLFEVLKTGYTVDVDTIESISCLGRHFGCRRKKRQEHIVRLLRHERR